MFFGSSLFLGTVSCGFMFIFTSRSKLVIRSFFTRFCIFACLTGKIPRISSNVATAFGHSLEKT